MEDVDRCSETLPFGFDMAISTMNSQQQWISLQARHAQTPPSASHQGCRRSSWGVIPPLRYDDLERAIVHSGIATSKLIDQREPLGILSSYTLEPKDRRYSQITPWRGTVYLALTGSSRRWAPHLSHRTHPTRHQRDRRAWGESTTGTGRPARGSSFNSSRGSTFFNLWLEKVQHTL